MKNLILIAGIPSIFMAIGGNFVKFKNTYQVLLECFTTGLLIVSGSMLLHEVKETSKTKIWGVGGFILSLLFIFLVSHSTKNSGVLPSLYFDSISDGLLLGALIPTFKNFKKALPLVIPMTLEMFITASATTSILQKKNVNDAKVKVSIAAIILGLSILTGSFMSKYINNALITGFGSASMLWLGLREFYPEIIKKTDVDEKKYSLVFLGILSALFME